MTWLALSTADRQDAVDSGQLLASWMQTAGAALLAVKWCSPVRMRVPAHDSRSAHGLLYPSANPRGTEFLAVWAGMGRVGRQPFDLALRKREKEGGL